MQDFVAGFSWSNGKLKVQPHAVRLARIRLALAADQFAPLPALVEMNAAAYNGGNDMQLGAEVTWAQGWSLMWFLATADKTTYRGREILDRYSIRWKHDHDWRAATAFAFEGVDWDVLEREWARASRRFADRPRPLSSALPWVSRARGNAGAGAAASRCRWCCTRGRAATCATR
jgi:hypothetical protein